MRLRRACVLLVLILLCTASAGAQNAKLPDLGEPLLRLEAGGPTGDVTALAFSPDGETLYAAGWDKVVRVWQRDAKTGQFVPQRTAYRVPLGPGLSGAINALALSSDGKWLAVGGLGAFRGQSGFRLPGLVVPREALTPEMREDEGTIFVFATAKPGMVRPLRGHTGPILSLCFVPSQGDTAPTLISAARSWEQKEGRYKGAVRAWDLSQKNAAIGQFAELPDPGAKLPGLAAWRAGDAIKVALAWDDGDFANAGALRLWDVRGKRMLVSTEPEGGFNNTVAFLGPDRLLTGSWQKKDALRGRLQGWKVGADDALTQGAKAATFVPGGDTVLVPRALGLVAANGDGRYDHAAVVLRVAPASKYRLQFVPLDAAGQFTLEDSLPLWDNGTRLPVLATAARGAFVAVAGSADHTIRVYAVADLLQKKLRPQLLQSIGARLAQAALVSKGQGKQRQLGLILSEELKLVPGGAARAPQAGDLLFDFASRRLSGTIEGWQLDTPAAAGWTHRPVAAVANEGAQIEVTSPAGKTAVIHLDVGRVVTDRALLPPQPPLGVPLLAVASTLGNEPELAIYNAATGDMLCLLTGHLGPISSLAFSQDGRFLVSAGSDQTVCLWTLIDLEPFVGKQGQLRGVVVQAAKNGAVVVTGVAPDSPAQKLIVKDDEILGLVKGGKLQKFASAPDFYDTLLLEQPGKDVTLRLGNGRDVAVPIGQAAQERTPLLVLFVTRGARPEDREWLAWNPLGPYDSSTPKMARAFGWHFSTGKADEPVQFTPADQDRAKERREGLLKHIVARASLVGGLKDWEAEQKALPLPPPQMVLDIDEMDQQRVRQPHTTARLHVDAIPRDRIQAVLWAVDANPLRPFPAMAGAEPTDYAQEIDWPRGVHKLRVVLRTNEEVSQEFTRTLTVDYAPPPPVVQWLGLAATASAGKPLATDQRTFVLEAMVKPGLAGETVAVQVRHQNALVEPVAPVVPKDGSIRRAITLQPGANNIALIAVHQGAVGGMEEAETTRLSLDIAYTPPKPPEIVPPPLIALLGIVPLVRGSEPADMLPIHADQAVVVAVPHVRLVGSIKGVRNLTNARRQLQAEAATDIARFQANSAKEFAIDEPLTLQPGLQKVTVRARAAKSGEAEQTVSLEYRPALPWLELKASPAGPLFYDDGQGPPEVRLSGRLVPARDPAPPSVKTTAVLQINGKPVPATIDWQALTWTALARLEPGGNRLQVRVSNAWQETTHGDLQLTYLRPPYALHAKLPATSKDKLLELTAQVDSLLPLDKKAVRGTVGNRALADFEVAPPADKGSTWTVRARVPLEPGANEIRLEVANGEGACRAPGLWTVVYVPPVPPPPPPQVVLLEPQATAGLSEYAIMVSRPRLPLQFRVLSTAPLKRVLLTVSPAGAPAQATSVDLSAVKKNGNSYELSAQTELNLAAGLTVVRIEADNEGNHGASPALLVNFVPPPVRIVLDALQTLDAGGPLLPIAEQPDCTLACKPAAKARLLLHGRVAWYQPDAALTQTQTVNVFVNGAQQWHGTLGAAEPGQLERPFKAEILLNRADGNDVEVELPGLKLPEHQVRRFHVGCSQPIPDRWLHVQIISTGEANVGKLVTQVLGTLQGTDYLPSKQSFRRAGFAQARLYRPLADDDLDEHRVVNQLVWIKNRIAERARDGWPNDVVFIYFVGGEAVDKNGRFVSLLQGGPQRPLITRQRLERAFADMLGVKVLLLDVLRETPSENVASAQLQREVAQWLETPTRHAWMRAAWIDAGVLPLDARLLTVLQKTLPGAASLADVTEGAEQHFRTLAKRYNGLRADSYLPPALRGLVLNAAR